MTHTVYHHLLTLRECHHLLICVWAVDPGAPKQQSRRRDTGPLQPNNRNPQNTAVTSRVTEIGRPGRPILAR